MASHLLVARNVLLSWSGLATRIVTGFVVLPFLINVLGAEGYGLWALIASATSAFAVLDLGTRGSLGRNIAFARARNDLQGINVLLSTCTTITSSAAVLAFLGSFAAMIAFFWFVDVPPERVAQVETALILAGLSIALTLGFSIFDATLWAHQRFDIINLVDITGSIVRLVLTFQLVTAESGLVTLALIQLIIGLASDLIKAGACALLIPGMRLRLQFIQRSAFGVLFDYGIWNFIGSIGRTVTSSGGPWIVGSRLGPALVTPFASAWSLLGYAVQIMSVGADVITPVATALHAQDKSNHQQQLFLEGSKFALALGLFFLGGFIGLGGTFLSLWIGPEFAFAGLLLVVLMLGELLPMSQIITRSIILGMGKPRVVATLVIAENGMAIPLALLIAREFGLLGICIVIAACALCCRGLGMLLAGCRLVQVPLWRVLLESFLPPLACAAAPIALLALAVEYRQPARWGELIAYGAAYGILFGILGVVFLIGLGPLRDRLRQRRARRQPGSPTPDADVSSGRPDPLVAATDPVS